MGGVLWWATKMKVKHGWNIKKCMKKPRHHCMLISCTRWGRSWTILEHRLTTMFMIIRYIPSSTWWLNACYYFEMRRLFRRLCGKWWCWLNENWHFQSSLCSAPSTKRMMVCHWKECELITTTIGVVHINWNWLPFFFSRVRYDKSNDEFIIRRVKVILSSLVIRRSRNMMLSLNLAKLLSGAAN